MTNLTLEQVKDRYEIMDERHNTVGYCLLHENVWRFKPIGFDEFTPKEMRRIANMVSKLPVEEEKANE